MKLTREYPLKNQEDEGEGEEKNSNYFLTHTRILVISFLVDHRKVGMFVETVET